MKVFQSDEEKRGNSWHWHLSIFDKMFTFALQQCFAYLVSFIGNTATPVTFKPIGAGGTMVKSKKDFKR